MMAKEIRDIPHYFYSSKFRYLNNAEFPSKFATRWKIFFFLCHAFSHFTVESKVKITKVQLQWFENIQQFHCETIEL